jgi:hypothetical protein
MSIDHHISVIKTMLNKQQSKQEFKTRLNNCRVQEDEPMSVNGRLATIVLA